MGKAPSRFGGCEREHRSCTSWRSAELHQYARRRKCWERTGLLPSVSAREAAEENYVPQTNSLTKPLKGDHTKWQTLTSRVGWLLSGIGEVTTGTGLQSSTASSLRIPTSIG